MIVLPDHTEIKRHVLRSLSRYWCAGSRPLEQLPVTDGSSQLRIDLPLRLVKVQLPDWASSIGVDGALLIPCELCTAFDSSEKSVLWQRVDWFLAAFLMMEAWHERVWEAKHGPIHSYSFRLSGWDARLWQHAWVNRIAMFLRVWAAQTKNTSSEALFGPLPTSQVLMTHDVDAVEKTLAIRLKQGVFTGINALRHLSKGKMTSALHSTRKSINFLTGQEDWWKFDEILSAEHEGKIKSVFHFHCDTQPKSLKRWLFDPGYDANQPRIKALIQSLHLAGHQVGLHPGFETWNQALAMQQQKTSLESISNKPVNACRQHWLRFSWTDTWSTQEKIGMQSDTTLMFNDRPGFRNASAVSWQPWNTKLNSSHQLKAQPTVLMDSHLYDYQQLDDDKRKCEIAHWLGECQAVHGEMAVLWHPHTLTRDYGWSRGFSDLLTELKQMRHT